MSVPSDQPVRPSETARGQAWLGNFTQADQGPARLLLDSLQIVSPLAMQLALKTELAQLATRISGQDATGVIVPVVSIEDVDVAVEARRRAINDDRERNGLARLPPHLGPHTAYETFEPGTAIPATPGSEGLIGNLVRDFTGDRPGREQPGWLHPGTPLNGLRDRNCEFLVLVSDYSGSGQQVCHLARTFVRNSRIRSWRSFGRFRIVVLTYAASWGARKVIERDSHIDELIVVTPGNSFADAQWTQDERNAIEDLCQRYTTSRTRKKALGHKGSAGLFLTHTAVPNNLPAILLRATSGWHSLFPNRVMPADFASELGDYAAPPRDLARLAEEAHQARLARAVGTRNYRARADLIATVLALVGHQRTTVPWLAHRTGRTDADITSIVGFLVAAGFVTPDLTLTLAGRKELATAKWLERNVTASLTGSTEAYYPQRLK